MGRRDQLLTLEKVNILCDNEVERELSSRMRGRVAYGGKVAEGAKRSELCKRAFWERMGCKMVCDVLYLVWVKC